MRRSRRCPPAVPTATALLLLATGCASGAEPDAASPAPPVASTPAQTSSPGLLSPTAKTRTTDPRSTPTVTAAIPVQPFYEAGDIDPSLQPLIDRAAADLAALLGVDVSDITTHAAVLVTWPDPSVGCPLPNMRYKQVPTDGSVIELQHAGTVYRYHTGGQRGPFQCQTPLAKAPARSTTAPER